MSKSFYKTFSQFSSCSLSSKEILCASSFVKSFSNFAVLFDNYALTSAASFEILFNEFLRLRFSNFKEEFGSKFTFSYSRLTDIDLNDSI